MIECPDFLPLGSVVRLRGNDKKLLLIGRGLVVEGEDGEKRYYDYSFVLYPEGAAGDTAIYSNHDCISEVVHCGYADEDDSEIVALLSDVLPRLGVEKADPKPAGEW